MSDEPRVLIDGPAPCVRRLTLNSELSAVLEAADRDRSFGDDRTKES